MADIELKFVLFSIFTMFFLNLLLGMVVTDNPEYEPTTVSDQFNNIFSGPLGTVVMSYFGFILAGVELFLSILTFGQFSFIGAISILPAWISGLLIILNGLTFILLLTYVIQILDPIIPTT